MIYRFKALDKKRQLDQLDSPLVLASPRGWVAVFVVLITTCMIGLWGFLGHIPRTTTATGVLGYQGGVQTIESPQAGMVERLLVQPGQQITTGQVIGSVRVGSGSVPVRAPSGGRVVSVSTGVGRAIDRGSDMLEIEPGYAASRPLEVSLRVDAQRVATVHRGEQVLMTVPGVSSRQFGLLRGTVTAVAPFPLPSASGSQQVSPTMVTVTLVPDANTQSGYAWTSADGPPIRLRSQTPVDAEINLGDVTPLSMLVGA